MNEEGGQVALMGESIGVHRLLVGEPEGRNLHGRPKLK